MNRPNLIYTQRLKSKLLVLCGLLFFGKIILAQSDSAQSKTSVKLSQQVINPTTLAWQLQLEEFAIFDTEGQDGFAQNFRFRGIIPLQRGWLLPFPQLIRVIAFVNTNTAGKTGLGDFTLNQFFILSKKDWGQFGAGWNLTAPTAAPKELGSPQWQIGPAFTVTFTNLGNWQMYWIMENFFSVCKNDQYGNNAFMVLQPNIFYTWANGIYAGMEPEWQYDYKTGKVGNTVFNCFVEPQYTMLSFGTQPQFQLFTGINVQFVSN